MVYSRIGETSKFSHNYMGGEVQVFAEELVKIKECETYAEELQKRAKIEAEAMIADAEVKAQQLMTESRAQAKAMMDKTLADGQQAAQKQYEAAVEETTKACAKLAETAEEKKNDMVKMIVERVKSSVNS